MINRPGGDPAESGTTLPPKTAAVRAARGFDLTIIKQYFYIVVRRIWLVALCFVASLTVTVLTLLKQVPTYKCETQLLLSHESQKVPWALRPEQENLWGDYLLTQMHILNSNLIKSRTAERLRREGKEVSGQIEKVAVNQLWQGSILAISVVSFEPYIGADYANALADEFLAFKAEQLLDTSQSNVMSLTQQANRLLDELAKAEQQLADYERDNDVVAVDERGNIAAVNLASMAEQAAKFRTQRLLLEFERPMLMKAEDNIVLATLTGGSAGLAAAGTGGGGLAAVQPAGPTQGLQAEEAGRLIDRGLVVQPEWVDLSRRKARLESELGELRENLKDAHPKVQEVLDELASVNRKIKVEVAFALKDFESKLDSLRIKEEASKRTQDEWQDDALDIRRKSKELGSMKRQVGRLQALYDLIFNRLKEIDLTVGVEPATIRILESAEPAGAPSSPAKLQTLAIGGLIGLGIGLVLVIGLDYIDDSIRFPEEVPSVLGVPFLGVIPAANWDPEDLRSHLLSNIDQKSGLAEAYRNLRSALLLSGNQCEFKSLVVTSAIPVEGKTTTCLNLGVSLAQAGARVLLVDGDLRRGELHKFFGLEGGRGLSDVLAGQAKPESVIQRTGLPNLDVVATGSFPPNPAELLLRPEFEAFTEYAYRSYDHVLFDCPPVLAVSESAVLAAQVDSVIFVVWAAKTSRRVCQSALQIIEDRGARVAGCVLNNLEFARTGYYYYSSYYGYYDYEHPNERVAGGASSRRSVKDGKKA